MEYLIFPKHYLLSDFRLECKLDRQSLLFSSFFVF